MAAKHRHARSHRGFMNLSIQGNLDPRQKHSTWVGAFLVVVALMLGGPSSGDGAMLFLLLGIVMQTSPWKVLMFSE